jgi:hypothetical protein
MKVNDMNEQIERLIYQGHPLRCEAEDYWNHLRDEMQTVAGQMIDTKQDIRAIILLNEIKRLDTKFPFNTKE